MQNCEDSIGKLKTYNRNMKSLKKKNVKSLKHLKVLKRRLNKWTKESDHGDIMIETLTQPLKNNKALISLRQFRKSEEEEKKKKSKAAFGELMVIHSDNLNSFIKGLQKIRDNLNVNNTMNEIIIDEWHINSDQSKWRKQLSLFAAKEICILYWPLAKETCYACEINEPSQRRHQCCQEPQQNLPHLFEQLVRQIDWSKFSEELENFNVETLLDDDEWYENTKDLSCKNLSLY